MYLYSVKNKIQKELADSNFNALLITSPDSVRYVLGGGYPFINVYTDFRVFILLHESRSPVLFVPKIAGNIAKSDSWYGSIVYYDIENSEQSSASRISMDLAAAFFNSDDRIGLELERLSVADYDLISEVLKDKSISDCSDWFDSLRMIKTDEEIDRLSRVARSTDHGIAGAMHHISAFNNVSEKYLSEDIRVHASERGCDVAAYDAVSQVVSGTGKEMIWADPPKYGIGWDKPLAQGLAVRCEMKGNYEGYYSNLGRCMLVGKVSEQLNVISKNAAQLINKSALLFKAGALASDIYSKIKEMAEESGLSLYPGRGVGYGIGVTACEGPDINRNNKTMLKENMVLVLDLIFKDEAEGWLRLKDMILVQEDTGEILGRYFSWDDAYTTAWTF